mgnify:CR=1 FL=1
MEKKDLKPAGVFKYFEEICQVPRPSKKEEKMIAYLKAFGAKHNLETKVDEAGNVLIKKPATPGKENLQTAISARPPELRTSSGGQTVYLLTTSCVIPVSSR